jgi:hypothetical protein
VSIIAHKRRERAGPHHRVHTAVDTSAAPKLAPVRRTVGRHPTISPTKEKTRDVGLACRPTIVTGSGVRL